MASVNKFPVRFGTITATENSQKRSIEQYQISMIAVLQVTAVDAGTFDCKLQHSANGIDWADIVTFAQTAGATYETIDLPERVLPNVRAVSTLAGGATSVDMDCSIYYDKRK